MSHKNKKLMKTLENKSQQQDAHQHNKEVQKKIISDQQKDIPHVQPAKIKKDPPQQKVDKYDKKMTDDMYSIYSLPQNGNVEDHDDDRKEEDFM
jgi:hypothetical protein